MSPNAPMTELRRAITALSRPLGTADRASGWSRESQQNMLRWLTALLDKAQRGGDISHDCRMIGRTLDSIDSGPLYDSVIAVQRACRGE
jgi:hypothetical protein